MQDNAMSPKSNHDWRSLSLFLVAWLVAWPVGWTGKLRAADGLRATSYDASDTGISASQGPSQGPSKDFALSLVVPLYWSSSVISADSETGGIDQPDWHTFPELSLAWSHQYDMVRLSSAAALSLDRYREVTSADINQIDTEFKATLTDGKSHVFVPYVRHAFVTYFERDFTSLDDRRHDFWAGIRSNHGFRDGNAIAYREAREPGDATAGLNVYAGRRLANDVSVQHWVSGVSLDFTYLLSRDWTLQFSPGVRVRWYDDEPGFIDRRDVRAGAIARAIWSPDWLTRLLPDSEIVFSADYQKNTSTDPIAEFEYWEIGPSLELTARF